MYKDFWQFSRRPFSSVTETGFFFEAQSHLDAIIKASYFLLESSDAIALIGDEGIGKSIVAAELARRISESCRVISIQGPVFDQDGMLLAIYTRLRDKPGDLSKIIELGPRGIYEEIIRLLKRLGETGRRVVVILDNIEMYSPECLSILFTLNNIKSGQFPVMGIMLIGSNDGKKIIRVSPEVIGRIGFWLGISPFTREECCEYIRHRLQKAGGEEDIFQPQAMVEVWDRTNGVPLFINRLCDLSLLSAFGEDRHEVTTQDIRYASSELKI